MFELNLIKDKAKARQRRRIIFLSVVSIVFLAGLLGMFFGSLFWGEINKLDTVNKDIAAKQSQINAMQAQLEIDEPLARKRRNGLIEAYNENMMVLADRPFFNPVLADIAEHNPGGAEFWYNDITITTTGSGATGPGMTADPFAAAKDLLGTRGLEASGYIEIEASDIVTESQLNQISEQMDGMVKLVGKPKFSLELGSEGQRGADSDAARYVPFSMRAAQTTFRGAGETP